MRIPLDSCSSLPLYRQIEKYLRWAIEEGTLPPGTRLPAIRLMAQDLGVNRVTVETAYAELAADGLVESRVGSGTWVSAGWDAPVSGPWPAWHQAGLPGPSGTMPGPSSSIRPEPSPDCIDLYSGNGDVNLFPRADFFRALQRVWRRDGVRVLQYEERQGFAPLRRIITQILASQGLATRPENVLVTSGSQQAMALVVQRLLRPGETVAVEWPSYAGALALFAGLGLRMVPVPMDGQGMQVSALAGILDQKDVRLIYTIPTFHNPTGVSLSGVRRRELVALAASRGVPILEDDYVGDLRYDGRGYPSLKALDSGGNVLLLGTFSKMLAPGLRVGYLVAEGPVMERLAASKQLHDLGGTALFQRALDEFVSVGRYQTHLRQARRTYRQRRDAVLQAVRSELPDAIQVDEPSGGLFLWLLLPSAWSAEKLAEAALEEGVRVMPGDRCFAPGLAPPPCLRLTFAIQAEDVALEGVRRLGRAMRKM